MSIMPRTPQSLALLDSRTGSYYHASMSNSYYTCCVSHAPITRRAMALPMAQSPYVTPTEHGPWWLFALPFFVQDVYSDLLAPPAEPGDRSNNTSGEIAESVCAAVSMRFVTDYIKDTNPDRGDLELLMLDNVFTGINPVNVIHLNGQLKNDFGVIASDLIQIFSEEARPAYKNRSAKAGSVIRDVGAPTPDLVAEKLAGMYDRCGIVRPGVVAISKTISFDASTAYQTIVDSYRCFVDGIRSALSGVPGWVVEQPLEDFRYKELATKRGTNKTSHNTIWDATCVIRLSDESLDEVAAKIEQRKRHNELCCDAAFLPELDRVRDLQTSRISAGFAYISEATWKAVLALPLPKSQRDWPTKDRSESDLVSFGNALSDYIRANMPVATGNGNAPTARSTTLQLPPCFDPKDFALVRLQQDLEYLFGTKMYLRDGDTASQRIASSIEDSVRLLIGINRAPPFYKGLLDLFLRVMIDGDDFLKDIAARSNLTIRECQEIVYRRIHQTKTVFDRLDYLRIKPTPAMAENRHGHCDTNYQAMALRKIATAIRAESAKESGRRKYNRNTTL